MLSSSPLLLLSNRESPLIRFLHVIFISLLLVNDNTSSVVVVNALLRVGLQQQLLQRPQLYPQHAYQSLLSNDIHRGDYHRTSTWLFVPEQIKTQCVMNVHCGLTCSLSSNSDSDNGATDAKGYVWYKLPSRTNLLAVAVQFGESIYSIQMKIHDRHVILFRDVDVADIMIYELDKSVEPLDARTKWNSSVYWGTEDAPLQIKVNIANEGTIALLNMLQNYLMIQCILT
jgi:hypothetical protein